LKDRGAAMCGVTRVFDALWYCTPGPGWSQALGL
jgi:hypothetical protein